MDRQVLIDANVVMSFLLAIGVRRSVIFHVIDAGIAGWYRMLIGEPTIREVETAYARKRHLREAIPAEQFVEVMATLNDAARILPPPAEPVLSVCRDPRDDYLIALALGNAASHLLTGDRDLLALDDRRFPFRILDAAALAAELGLTCPT